MGNHLHISFCQIELAGHVVYGQSLKLQELKYLLFLKRETIDGFFKVNPQIGVG